MLLAFLVLRTLRQRSKTQMGSAFASLFLIVAGLVLLGIAAAWLGVLFSADAVGSDLPEGLVLAAFLLFWLFPLGAMVAVVVGFRAQRRRGIAREPVRRPFPWRLAVAAFPVSLALAALVELVRPWTVGFWA